MADQVKGARVTLAEILENPKAAVQRTQVWLASEDGQASRNTGLQDAKQWVENVEKSRRLDIDALNRPMTL